jgi:hypothetical protein
MHTTAEGPPQEEHGATVNAALLFAAFVGTVLTIGLVVVLTYLYFTSHMNQLRRSRIETTVLAGEYRDYRERTTGQLRDYGWVSIEGDGVVALPMEVAMERVLRRYNGAGQGGGSQ